MINNNNSEDDDKVAENLRIMWMHFSPFFSS